MKPKNAEYIGVDCGLCEESMDDAAYKILEKIKNPHAFTLTVNQYSKFRALRLARNSCYPAPVAVIVDNGYASGIYGIDEWSLAGEDPAGGHCVWSPGA